jgi:hypothetical protein
MWWSVERALESPPHIRGSCFSIGLVWSCVLGQCEIPQKLSTLLPPNCSHSRYWRTSNTAMLFWVVGKLYTVSGLRCSRLSSSTSWRVENVSYNRNRSQLTPVKIAATWQVWLHWLKCPSYSWKDLLLRWDYGRTLLDNSSHGYSNWSRVVFWECGWCRVAFLQCVLQVVPLTVVSRHSHQSEIYNNLEW